MWITELPLKRLVCSTDNAEGDNTNQVVPIHTKQWPAATLSTKENNSAKEGKLPAYKGFY